MTKLNQELQSLTLPYASGPDLEPARRLIVPVTSPEADFTIATQRVWELASATGAHIKFIGLCHDPVQEFSLRRALVTMSAMVNYDNIFAETEVLFGKDWVGNLKSRLQAGDMVVCLDGQRAGLLQKPLNQILQSELDVPLYVLSGLHPQNESLANWTTRTAAWIGSIAIIIGFFALQIKIDHLAKDWTIVLQILTTAVEFWLLWIWNNLFR